MRNSLYRLRLYLAAEMKKIRPLPLRGKLRYISDYYRLWILGIGALLFLSGYVICRAAFTPKDFWFYGVFANSLAGEGDVAGLRRDFISFAGYDLREKKVEINASSWFDPSVAGGTANSYFQAFVAMAESGDLDVLVMGRDGLIATGSSGRLLDLSREEVSGLLEKYEDRILWCDPYDEEYSDSEVPIGIDISDSLLVTKYHLYDGDCALGIGAWTKRPESAAAFLQFVLPDEE